MPNHDCPNCKMPRPCKCDENYIEPPKRYLKPSTKSGTPIWFQPIAGGARFAAVTDGQPYTIGQRIVVDIQEVTPTYAIPNGKVRRVAFTFLYLRESHCTDKEGANNVSYI